MREAIGDLNMTVVIVLIVAVLVAFFSMVIRPIIVDGIKSEANCSDAICTDCDRNNMTCKCKYKGNEVTCPYKG